MMLASQTLAQSPRRDRAAPRRNVLRAVLALLVLAFAGSARAQDDGLPVVEAGREAELQALFQPHTLGADVVPGWRLMGIRVEQSAIVVTVESGSDSAELRLEHPDRASEADERTSSFAVTRGGDRAGRPALDALMVALRANDGGDFWRPRVTVGVGSVAIDATGTARLIRTQPWYLDGLLLLVLFFLVLFGLVARQLRQSPAWVAWSLLGITALAAVLRLTVSVESAQGVAPFARFTDLFRLMYDGHLLPWLADVLGVRIYLTDMMLTTNLLLAIATPLAMFTHAHYVLGSPVGAVATAAITAVLPIHLRFSHTEVELIPSIAISAVAFALLHAALVEPNRLLRALATFLLPLLVIAAIYTRELNILLIPLMLGAIFGLRTEPRPWKRDVLVTLAVALAGAAGYFGSLVPRYAAQMSEGLSLSTLVNAWNALWSVQWNTLVNPWITPPGLLLLAIAGAVLLWKRDDRRHAVFLVLWLALYFGCHSLVLPQREVMQARYHLHLAPPFILLAAAGLTFLLAERRRLGLAAAAYVAASPLIHLDFIRDVAYSDMAEYAFVDRVRDSVPDSCTVLEFPGAWSHDVRFGRMGAVIEHGAARAIFRPVAAGTRLPPGERDEAALIGPYAAAVLADPPACLYYYEGLECWTDKEPSEPIAPACQAMRERLALETVASETITSRHYDEWHSYGLTPGVEHLELSLHRVTGVKQP